MGESMFKRSELVRLVLGVGIAAASGGGLQAAPAVDHDGPFGIAMGEPLADLGPVQAVQPGAYLVLRPPRPNSEIEQVVVTAFPNLGVCRIQGLTSDNEFDNTGSLARSAADRLAEALKPKYGEPAKATECNGSEDECANAWVQEVRQGAARYIYGWGTPGPGWPANIGKVILTVHAASSTDTFVSLSYASTNDAACAAALSAAAGSSL
jgi:hypothetical protein